MKGPFYVVGLVAGLCLTVADFITSWMGFSRLLPVTSTFYTFMPIVMASLALAMNASATAIVNKMIEQQESQFSFFLTSMSFLVCVAFDGGSSWVGFITEFGGSPDFWTAWKTLNPTMVIAASVTSIFVTIGPFLTTQFHDLVRAEGGVFACLLGAFLQEEEEQK